MQNNPNNLITPETVAAGIEEAMSNCLLKGGISIFMGGAFGFLFGTFFGTNMTTPLPEPGEPKIPLRVQMMQHLKESGRVGMQHARNFAAIGGLFATTQCVIEKSRAVNNPMNGLYAGCLTGAMLAYKGGPSGIALGCAGFGAFSYAIDHFMEEVDPRDEMVRFDPYQSKYLRDLAEDEAEARLIASKELEEEPLDISNLNVTTSP